MCAQLSEALGPLRALDADALQAIIKDKLRPPRDFHGLRLLRMSAMRERDLRELYRGRAPYELLQNADDVGATRAAFVLASDGLGFLHNGDWFSVRNFESLAFGWSDKDPKVCIGHKGLGFRSVLDITPSPHLFQVGTRGFFGVKFTWALNNGHIQETLRSIPKLKDEIRGWGALATICPVMSIPGPVPKKSVSGSAAAILERAARNGYGEGYTTLFWLPATDREIDLGVLRDLGPTPLTVSSGTDQLRRFITSEVSALILFLRHILDVRLYQESDLVASVIIPGHGRTDAGDLSVVTEAEGQAQTRTFFQVRTTVEIPRSVRAQPDTPLTLRALDIARLALSAEIIAGRPVADPEAHFHVYFPTQELTGLGFVVHGDFYVKPDRTRLMPGEYNDWLFSEAAALAAGRFLNGLLARARPRDVFETLRPTAAVTDSAGARFVRQFGERLRTRTEAFIPTSSGPQLPARAALPSTIDSDGDWDRYVGNELARTRELRLLLPSEDSREARMFLELAGTSRLEAATFVSLVESAGAARLPPSWWYGCYAHMAKDVDISRWKRELFVGKRLVPTSRESIAAVHEDASQTVLILPPRGRTDLPEPPRSFATMLELVEPGVADLLWEDEETRSWVTSRFHVATFEVTDLLRRVLPAVALQLYTANGAPSTEELLVIWRFVRAALDAAARPIFDEDVWQAMGRLPLPTELRSRPSEQIPPVALVPAFLAYFPDEWLGDGLALTGVNRLRRIVSTFLALLEQDEPPGTTPWRTLLERAHVSGSPKVLTYRRIVPGPPLSLTPEPPRLAVEGPFTGNRQQDENRAALELVASEDLWSALAADAARCQRHPHQALLSEARFIEGLGLCVTAALDEWGQGSGKWLGRLRQLARELPAALLSETEVVTTCQRCNQEGRAVGGAAVQLERQRWVPSSWGPWTRDDSFLRLAGNRLIGLEPGGEELGDLLLPYAVASTVDEFRNLEMLGLDPLQDAPGASATTLLRFLRTIGGRLSQSEAIVDVIGVRARWRLVRGAIQEAYRALNRIDGLSVPTDLTLAVRTADGPRFRPAPWYFAEPGSLIERAFGARLNIVDADRRYDSLFRQLGVTTLAAGQTVNEALVGADGAPSADRLRGQIMNGLAPLLLALVIGRSDNPQHANLVGRRLHERFAVRSATDLRLALALTDESTSAEVAVDSFYLQRSVVESEDLGHEAVYTLYAIGDPDQDLFAVDGDALGTALAPVFLEGPSAELAGLFPRVVTRFQFVRGDAAATETFMLHQIGVSLEAQTAAIELLRGTPLTGEERISPAPRIVPTEPSTGESMSTARESALSRLRETYDAVKEGIAARLTPAHESKGDARHFEADGGQLISPEQQARGRRGEEELKRRLLRPEGWEGFQLVSDRRKDRCGYDFLCRDAGGAECKLEVKTFVPEGRVVVSLRELQEAQAGQRGYYLVGLCDNGETPDSWPTYILQDPIGRLLRLGDFQFGAMLEALSVAIFAMVE